jgi:mannosyltransferase
MKPDIKRNYRIAALFSIIVLGAILRLYNLGSESIWLDEGYSVAAARLSFWKVVTYVDDFPPMYYVILHGWVKLFGDSEFSIRFPSLIFGVLSIGIIYQLGKLLFDEQKGLIAALLLALSSFHIVYSQEARPYSLTLMLALLSMREFIRCHQQGKLNHSVGYIVYSTLLMYAHVIGLFLIAAQNLYVVGLYLLDKSHRTLRLSRWFLLQASIALLFLPWIPTFMGRAFDEHRLSWLEAPTLMDLLATLKRFAGRDLLKLCIPLMMASIVTLKQLRSGGGSKASIGSYLGKLPRPGLADIKENGLLLLCLSLPILIPFLLSFVLPPMYNDRYAIIGLFAFALMVASGIGNLRPVALRLLIIAVFITFGMSNAVRLYHTAQHAPWREVARYIDQHAGPEDLLIFDRNNIFELCFKYYSISTNPPFVVTPPDTEVIDGPLLKQWSEVARDHQRVWVVQSDGPEPPHPILQSLAATHTPVSTVKNVHVVLHLLQLRD